MYGSPRLGIGFIGVASLWIASLTAIMERSTDSSDGSFLRADEAQAPLCAEAQGFHALDFWIGEWAVWSDGRQVGTNTIRSVQGGCALEEHWTSAAGGTGQSLFYYLPVTRTWKQVWVTPAARAPGGVKEKTRVAAPDGSVRFRGTIERPDGTSYLDRTTLTPLPRGRVRQHIEVSVDGGRSWETTFDAEYRPAG